MTPKRLRSVFTGSAAPAAVLATLGLLMLPLAAAAQTPTPPPPGSPASGIPAAAQPGVSQSGMASPGAGEVSEGAIAPGTAAYANMAVRMDNLQSEIDSLNGHIQVIDHELQQLSDRIEKLTKDVDFRLSALEGHGAAPGANAAPAAGAANMAAGQNATQNSTQNSPSSPPPGAAGSAFREPPPHPLGSLPANAPLPEPEANRANTGQANTGSGAAAAPEAPEAVVTLPKGSPEAQYKFATDFLRRGEYAKAGQAFEQFLKAHPKNALASNAQYWLGETYYVRRLYAKSAATFLAGYRQDPRGDKAPADLLKLGMSLIALKKQPEACAVFKQLDMQYPHAEPRIKQYAARERERAKCS